MMNFSKINKDLIEISPMFGYDKEDIIDYLSKKMLVREFDGKFDESGRLVIKLHDNDLELLDIGYGMLKEKFNVSYQDFRRNKITIDNCERKLFKHLLTIGFNKDFLETVSKYKLPSSELFFVLSVNYGDMLLASTKNSFTSCIDLEKGEYSITTFGNLFSNGRAIAYLTDLTPKEHLGVKSFKMFLRSFVVVDQNGNLRNSLIYPLRTTMEFNVGDLKIKPIDKKTKIKYNYDIRLNKFNFMIFPYIDNGCIIKSTKTKGFIEYYGEIKNRANVILNDNKVYDYNSILKHCSEKGLENIDSLIKKHCDCCGSLEQKNITIKGKNYCESCIDELNVSCDFCGKAHKKIRQTIDGKVICETCRKKEELTICKTCGSVFAGSKELTQCTFCSLHKDDVYKKISYKNNDNFYDFDKHVKESDLDNFLTWDEELGEYILKD